MTVGIGQFTEKQIQHLLRALAAKAGLDFREIVGAYATRKTKIANNFLEVHRDFAYRSYMCGSNPLSSQGLLTSTGDVTATLSPQKVHDH